MASRKQSNSLWHSDATLSHDQHFSIRWSLRIRRRRSLTPRVNQLFVPFYGRWHYRWPTTVPASGSQSSRFQSKFQRLCDVPCSFNRKRPTGTIAPGDHIGHVLGVVLTWVHVHPNDSIRRRNRLGCPFLLRLHRHIVGFISHCSKMLDAWLRPEVTPFRVPFCARSGISLFSRSKLCTQSRSSCANSCQAWEIVWSLISPSHSWSHLLLVLSP